MNIFVWLSPHTMKCATLGSDVHEKAEGEPTELLRKAEAQASTSSGTMRTFSV